ncbi:MAG TPA: hypothetical protein VG755_17835 [Nannocystaceae bacterium]|nr:hypothetical protein [Nannocystaceae bacterium]
MRRLVPLLFCACTPTDAPATAPEEVVPAPVVVTERATAAPAIVPRLAVHEWGTFTAVAGDDGVALEWRPLVGPSDLPTFVYDITKAGIRDLGANGKGDMTGTMRMETPVIYFYATEPIDVSVAVGFPSGSITEWYPKAKSIGSHGIDWGTVRILPDEDVVLPQDRSDSHYYPARKADADVVRVCDAAGAEHEGFLFYRGVGGGALQLAVTLDGDRMSLRDRGATPLREAIVFENREGAIGIATIDPKSGERFARPALDDTLEAAIDLVEARLLDSGLRPAEVDAMIETWRGDWFEPGLRVIYLLPRAETDAMLPLAMMPPPQELVRTMVGRIEVITPELEQSIAETLWRIDRPGHEYSTVVELADQSRFVEPVLERLLAKATTPRERKRLTAVLELTRTR